MQALMKKESDILLAIEWRRIFHRLANLVQNRLANLLLPFLVQRLAERPGDGPVGELAARDSGGCAADRCADGHAQRAEPQAADEPGVVQPRPERGEPAGGEPVAEPAAAQGAGDAANRAVDEHLQREPVGRQTGREGAPEVRPEKSARPVERPGGDAGDEARLQRLLEAGPVQQGVAEPGRGQGGDRRREPEFRRGCVEGACQREYEVAAGVCVRQRVVQRVAIAIVALQVGGELHERVGPQEAAEVGVVDPSVHVDCAHGVEHLVAGETAPCCAIIEGSGRRLGEARPVVGVPSDAPGREAHGLGHCALGVDQPVHAAQVVAQHVAHGVGLAAAQGRALQLDGRPADAAAHRHRRVGVGGPSRRCRCTASWSPCPCRRCPCA